MTTENGRPLPPDPIVCSAEFSGDGCHEPPMEETDETEKAEEMAKAKKQ